MVEGLQGLLADCTGTSGGGGGLSPLSLSTFYNKETWYNHTLDLKNP